MGKVLLMKQRLLLNQRCAEACPPAGTGWPEACSLPRWALPSSTSFLSLKVAEPRVSLRTNHNRNDFLAGLQLLSSTSTLQGAAEVPSFKCILGPVMSMFKTVHGFHKSKYLQGPLPISSCTPTQPHAPYTLPAPQKVMPSPWPLPCPTQHSDLP